MLTTARDGEGDVWSRAGDGDWSGGDVLWSGCVGDGAIGSADAVVAASSEMLLLFDVVTAVATQLADGEVVGRR